MIKLKDRIILGAVCGLMAGAIGRATNAIEYNLKWTDQRFNQPGASLFLPKTEAKANTPESKIIASLVNNTMVGVTGVVITYIISITGRDKAMIKGAGVGAMSWMGIWGLFGTLGITVKSNKPLTHILSFVDHVVFGANIGLFASKLGDDSLFPDSEVSNKNKLPLVAVPIEPSKS